MKLFVAVLLCLALAAEGVLDFHEGDYCKEENGSLWTCKKLNQCQEAQGVKTVKRNSEQRQQCKSNAGDPEPVVCCEPQKVKTSPAGSKSKEMCKMYAEAVYVKEPTAFGDRFISVDTCGAVEPLITNGQNAQPREYPHMALIGYGEKGSVKWLAGGSLISDQFILSAAHCTNLGNRGLANWVRLGEYNLRSTDDDESGSAQPKDYEIIDRINYPLYNTSSDYHDIALFKLASKVEFNQYIRPICLQTEHQFPKTYVIATGWGRTKWGGRTSDILQKVNLMITPRRDCNNAYSSKAITRQRGITYKTMFCAGDIEHRKDTCQSDSGGPLQNRLTDPYCMYVQVGITSFGEKCASDKPGVYTRVSHYVPWIESKVWP